MKDVQSWIDKINNIEQSRKEIAEMRADIGEMFTRLESLPKSVLSLSVVVDNIESVCFIRAANNVWRLLLNESPGDVAYALHERGLTCTQLRKAYAYALERLYNSMLGE